MFSEHMRRDISFLVIFSFMSSLMLLKEYSVNNFLGFFMICILLLSIYYRDILRYSPEYIRQQKYLLLLGVLVVGTLASGRIFDYFVTSLSKGLGYLPADTSVSSSHSRGRDAGNAAL